MNQEMIKHRLNKAYTYSSEGIGIQDMSKGFKLIFENNEFLICCDNVRFNIDVASDLLNELNNKNMKIKKEIETELNYLENKAMDNQVNQGRIRALKQLQEVI